jgi:hypothetical protein
VRRGGRGRRLLAEALNLAAEWWSARCSLGEPAFDAAYARGRALSSDDALALAKSAVAVATTAG